MDDRTRASLREITEGHHERPAEPQRMRQDVQNVTATAGRTITEASGRARQITTAFLPEDLAARLRHGEEDLSAFLPDAPGFRDRLPD